MIIWRIQPLANDHPEDPATAWDGKGVARVGGGEEGVLVGGAEPGDPSLAGEAVLPMKLRVYRLGICLLVSVQLFL